MHRRQSEGNKEGPQEIQAPRFKGRLPWIFIFGWRCRLPKWCWSFGSSDDGIGLHHDNQAEFIYHHQVRIVSSY